MGIESKPEDTKRTENIRVLVRIRPLLERESDTEAVTEINEDESTINIETEEHAVSAKFDGVFSGETSQEGMYEHVKYCSESVVDGYNSTIFAYGQTGSGKTYTMFGPEDDLDIYSTSAPSKRMGLIPRAIRDVLNDVKAKAKEGEDITVYASFMQIYNDQPFDLLRDPMRVRPLQVHEDARNGDIFVVGLSEYAVDSLHDCLALLEQGDEQRASRETKMNDVSSRSHSIFQLLLEKNKDNGTVIRSKLNLVDLAGSEKWGLMDTLEKSHVSELTNINSSLHTLGRCIQALTQPNVSHVPFRDSKLTRILQDALGGNSRTCIIATLSPSEAYIEETISTLKFADRAKRVMQHARIVETRVIDLALVLKLEKQISLLKTTLERFTGQKIPDTDLEANLAQLTPAGINVGNISADNDYSENNDENEVPSGVMETMKKQMLYANKEVQRLQKENNELKLTVKNQPAVSSTEEKPKILEKKCIENQTLWKAVKNIKTSAGRFFKFEIEEEEFQQEFKRACSLLKTINDEPGYKSSPSKSANRPDTIEQDIPIHMPSIKKHFGKAKKQDDLRGRLRLAGNCINNAKPSLNKNNKLKVRTRQKASGKNESNDFEEEINNESTARILGKQLQKKKEKLAKHRKLQEWIAQKAEREIENLEAEKQYRKEQEKQKRMENKKWKKRAEQVKAKLHRMKHNQLDLVDNASSELDSPFNEDYDEDFNYSSLSPYSSKIENGNNKYETFPVIEEASFKNIHSADSRPMSSSTRPMSRQHGYGDKNTPENSSGHFKPGSLTPLDPHRPLSRQPISEDRPLSRQEIQL